MDINLTEDQELINVNIDVEEEIIEINATDIVESIIVNATTFDEIINVNPTTENIVINTYPEVEQVTINTVSEIEDVVININTDVSGEGTMFHNELVNLDYASSGHTGFASKVDLDNKVDKEEGKELSSNDFTDLYKTKLDELDIPSLQNVQSDWRQLDNTKDDYIKRKPTKLSEFANDVNYIISESDPIFRTSPAGGITDTNISNWNDAYSKKHTHNNKLSLDLVSGENTGDETKDSIISKLEYTPENILNKGLADGYVPLDSNTKIDYIYFPDYILGQLKYIGVWNASLNSPMLTGTSNSKGDYYIVSISGNTDLNGINDWKIGDWAVFNGLSWDKIDNTDAISSFNGRTGAILLSYTDVVTALNFTPVPVDRAITINGVTHNLISDSIWNVGDILSTGYYANPEWITSLAWNKITDAPSFITSASINTLTDVLLTPLSSGDLLKYNGNKWINTLLSSDDIPNLDMSKINTGNLSWSRISSTPATLLGYGISSSDTLFDTKYQPMLPAAPLNPSFSFLNGNLQWSEISIGSGGNSSNIYFTLNSSDVSGYRQLSYIPDIAETQYSDLVTNSEVLFATYLGQLSLDLNVINSGTWSFYSYIWVDKITGITQMKYEPFVRHINGTETILFSVYSEQIVSTSSKLYSTSSTQNSFNVLPTDRLGIRVYGKTTSSAAVNITRIIGDGRSAYLTTPLPLRHNQLRDLNNDVNYLHSTETQQTNWNNAYTFANNYTTNYPDLVAIENISGTNGLLKKTGTNTWTLDTNSYVTGTPWTSMGYLTSASLSDYATQTWVSSNYAPLNGTGTSGTWGINISGTADMAQKANNVFIGSTSINATYGLLANGSYNGYFTPSYLSSVYVNPALGKLYAAEFIVTTGGNGILRANGSIDNTTYLSAISSSMVINALGYTPYNSSNPSNYITTSALSGYALQSWVTSNYLGLHSRADLALGLDGTYISGGQEKPDYFKYYGAKVQMINLGGWSDMLYLNGYAPTNGSGMDVPYVNAIAFQKTPNGSVYHSTSNYGDTSTWGTWYKFLDEYNYNSFSPKLDGTGSYGTWGINISGTAANATKWNGVECDLSGYVSSLAYLLGVDSPTNKTRAVSPNQAQTWLGLNNNSTLTNYAKGLRYPSYVSTDGAYYENDHYTFGSFCYNSGTMPNFNDGYILSNTWGGALYVTQLALDVDPSYGMAIRHRDGAGNWNAWKNILTEVNVSSYALPLTGGTVNGTIEVYPNAHGIGHHPAPSGWSYDRWYQADGNFWDIGTNQSTGILGGRSFDIRQSGTDIGIAVRWGTSSYGKLVVANDTTNETSIGYINTNYSTTIPVWTVGSGIGGLTNFAWWYSGEGTRMTLDASGNLSTLGYAKSNTGYLDQNMLDTTNWSNWIGGALQGNWNNNAGSGTNVVTWSTDPFGKKALVLVGTSAGVFGGNSGWNYNNIPINYNKAYRLVVFFKVSVDNSSGSFYLGCSGGNSINLDGSSNNNPYFFGGVARARFALDRWYMAVGYIHAYNDTDTTNYSKIYDCESGIPIESGYDYRNTNGASVQTHRTYQYYDTVNGAKQYYWGARFEEINGKEPSIEALLGRHKTETVGGSMYVSKIYDRDDTTYYLDPSSASSLRVVNVIGYNSEGGGLNINWPAAGLAYMWGGSFNGTNDWINLTNSTTAPNFRVQGSICAQNRFWTGYDSGQTNSMSCSNWFRSANNTGWYNQTYGGGIWMQNSTWVEVYGGKNFYCGATIKADTDVRAPIFYDSADTNYYLDPNNVSRLYIVKANALGVVQTNGGGDGLSLYGDYTGGQPTYGIMFALTSNFSTHGAVTADWATYFTMDSTSNRGWIFRNSSASVNVASISNGGTAYFNGDVYAPNFILSSDRNLKMNIQPISNNEKDVEYKSFEFISKPGDKRYGVIAQELREIYPELVEERPDGYLTVKYIDLFAKEISYLRNKIKELERRFN